MNNQQTGWAAHATLLIATMLVVVGSICASEGLQTGKPGETFSLGGKTVTIKRIVMLPVVENVYAAAHTFEPFADLKLAEFRTKNKLDDVVRAGTDEFDQQVRLLDWVHKRFKKFGTPTSKANNPAAILQAVDEGQTFFCAHYGTVLVGAAQCLGWPARVLGLKRPDNLGERSTEHTVTEIWSNQYGKWILFDPTYAVYMEKDGQPLNAWEMRQEWFYQDWGKHLTFVVHATRDKHPVGDLPITLAVMAGYGTMELSKNTLYKYAFLAYQPESKVFANGQGYGGMFITKDKLCDGTKWHTRQNPADPANDPYFPLNQADLSMMPGNGLDLHVSIKTMTPSFKTFQKRVDGKDWADCGNTLTWTMHPGANVLEVRSVNALGVVGHVSTVELDVK
ncbi:MAG: transglutaminase-like domain-containing protein [Planctomycetota bacterium]